MVSFRAAFMAVVVFGAVSPARADEVLYRYEGDVLRAAMIGFLHEAIPQTPGSALRG